MNQRKAIVFVLAGILSVPLAAGMMVPNRVGEPVLPDEGAFDATPTYVRVLVGLAVQKIESADRAEDPAVAAANLRQAARMVGAAHVLASALPDSDGAAMAASLAPARTALEAAAKEVSSDPSAAPSRLAESRYALKTTKLASEDPVRDAMLAPPATIWTSENDGHGSGLDADTLDGVHAADILAWITAEAEAREQGSDLLRAALDDEIAARIAADEALQAALQQEAADRAAAVAAERDARIAGDADLLARLASEADARAAADDALAAGLDSERADRVASDARLRSDLDEEIAARIAADTDLADRLVAEIAAREAAVAAEAETRADADSLLRLALDQEIAERIAAIDDLQTQIDALRSDIAAEIAARQAADAALRADLDREIADRTAADAAEAAARAAGDDALRASIDDERSAREAADADLSARLDDEIAAREAAVAAEAQTRADGDALLRAALDDEIADREAAIAAVQAQLDALRAGLSDETAARIAADDALRAALDAEAATRAAAVADLQDQLDAEVAAREAAIAAEAQTRADGDALLRAALDQEIRDRTAAVQDLQDQIRAETAAREAADAALRSALDDEIAARIAADDALSARLDAESAARAAAVADLQDQLDAEVAAREAAVAAEAQTRADADALLRTALDQEIADRTSEIARLEGRIGALEAGLAQERADRALADDALSGRLDREVADRASGDASLRSSLDSETADRLAGDAALRDALDGEAASRAAGDAGLGSRIDSESAARQAADSNLQTQIDSLGSDLDAERDARLAGDASLRADLDAERAAREAADAAESSAREGVSARLDQEVADRIAGDEEERSARETAVRDLRDRLAAEAAARDAAVTDEARTRSDADAALDAALEAERQARDDADAALHGRVDTEIADRAAAVASLRSEMIASDASLRAEIEDEARARDAAIAAEAGLRSDGDSLLRAALDREIADRGAAIAGLQSQLDALAARVTDLESYVNTGNFRGSTLTLTGDITADDLFANDLHAGDGFFRDGVRTAGQIVVGREDPYNLRTDLEVRATTGSSADLLLGSAAGRLFNFAVDDDGAFRVSDVSSGTYVERVALDSAGRVGIGQASPGAQLDVAGTLRVTNGAANTAAAILLEQSGLRATISSSGDPEGLHLTSGGGSVVVDDDFVANGASSLNGFTTITNAGNPGALALDSARPTVSYAKNGVFQWDTGVDVSSENFFLGDGSYRVQVQRGTGNVAIGTAPSANRLEVAGTIRASNLVSTGTATVQDITLTGTGGIRFPADPFGGLGDLARVYLASSGGENSRLTIESQNDAGDGVTVRAGDVTITRNNGGTGNLVVSDGAIGVGGAPSAGNKLEVLGKTRLAGDLVTTGIAGIGTTPATGAELHVRSASGNADFLAEAANGKAWALVVGTDGTWQVQDRTASLARLSIATDGTVTVDRGLVAGAASSIGGQLDVNGNVVAAGDLVAHGTTIVLDGAGGGLGNNAGAARALVDLGSAGSAPDRGLAINYRNDFGHLLIGGPTTIQGDLALVGTLTQGAVPWARITEFPTACGPHEVMTGVGQTLACTSDYVTLTTPDTISGAKTFTSDVNLAGADLVLTSSTPGGADVRSSGGADSVFRIENTGGALGRTALVGGGAERLVVENAGDVGIGTSDPSRKLDVVGTARATAFESGTLTLDSLGDALVLRPTTMGTGQKTSIVFSDPTPGTQPVRLTYVDDGTAGLGVMGGNLGVGTENPAHPLDVGGAARISQSPSAPGNQILLQHDGSAARIGSAGDSSGLRLQSGGGVVAVDDALDVNGQVTIRPGAAGGLAIDASAPAIDLSKGGVLRWQTGVDAADTLFVGDGATKRLELSRLTGNLGLGTAPSTYRLDVGGAGHFAQNVDANGRFNSLGGSAGGFTRDWMANGLLAAGESDAIFVGLKNEGPDRSDAVVAFGDNADDALRFLYAASGATNAPTVDVARLSANGDFTFLGRLNGGAVPWARLTEFPAACGAHQVMTGVGGTLACTSDYVTLTTADTISGAKTFTSHVAISGSNLVLTSPAETGADIESNGGTDSIFGITNTGGPGGRTVFVGGGAERLAIENTGDVGIGTSDPSRRLDVAGTGRIAGLLEATGGLAVGGPSSLAGDAEALIKGGLNGANADLLLEAANGERWNVASTTDGKFALADVDSTGTVYQDRLVVDSLGRVGIGQANPASALDVLGDVQFSGTLVGGTVPWVRLDAYPSCSPATPAPVVTGLGDSLSCTSDYVTASTTQTVTGAKTFTGGATVSGTNLDVVGGNVVLSSSGTGGDLRSDGGSDGVFLLDSTAGSGGRTSVASGGAELFTVRNTGNVGVGQVSPSTKLDVAGPAQVTSSAAAPWDYLRIRHDGTAAHLEAGDDQSGLHLSSELDKIYLDDSTVVAGDLSFTGTLTGGAVPWGRLTEFPSCPATTPPSVVTGVGSTLTCTSDYLTVTTGQTITGAKVFDGGAAAGTAGFHGSQTDLWFTGGSDSAFLLNNVGGLGGRTSVAYKGSELLSVRNTGNVGIGTTNPLFKLDVSGSGRFTDTVTANQLQASTMIRSGAAYASGINKAWMTRGLAVEQGTDGVFLGMKNEGADRDDAILAFGDNADDALRIRFHSSTSETDLVKFEAGGNVGIGTTTPGQRLDVAGSARVSDDAIVGRDLSVARNLDTAGTSRLLGNVGVGQSPGAEALSVTGTSRLLGNVGVNQAPGADALGVTGSGRFTDDVIAGRDLSAGRDATVGGALAVTGLGTFGSSVAIADDATVADDAAIGGTLTMTGDRLITFGSAPTQVSAPSDNGAGWRLKAYDSSSPGGDYGISIANAEMDLVSGGRLGFYTGSLAAGGVYTRKVTIDTGGNVGIGTTTDDVARKLDVAGTGRFTGLLEATSGVAVTGGALTIGGVPIGTTGATIDKGSDNVPALLVTSSSNGHGSGVQFENTGASGRKYSAYSSAVGNFVLGDETAQAIRLSISPTGAATFTGSVTAPSFTGDGTTLTNVVHIAGTETITGAKTFDAQTRLTPKNDALVLRPNTMLGGEKTSILFQDPDAGTAPVRLTYVDDASPALGVMGGSFGVGTENPTHTLEVVGTSRVSNWATFGGAVAIGSTGALASWEDLLVKDTGSGNGDLAIAASNNERWNFASEGAGTLRMSQITAANAATDVVKFTKTGVGILQMNPGRTLDVTGTGRFTGALDVNGLLTATNGAAVTGNVDIAGALTTGTPTGRGLDVLGRDVVGGPLPVSLVGSTTGMAFGNSGSQTHGRIVRLANTGTSNAFYDVGIDSVGDLFVTGRNGNYFTDGVALAVEGKNVGIQTKDPTHALDVAGTARVTGALTLGGTTVDGGDVHANGGSDSLWYLRNTGASTGRTAIVGQSVERFVVENTGDVGIGTTDPARRLDVVGTARATAFEGDGALLANLNAANVASGTLADARLSSNVPLKDAANTFSGANTFAGPVRADAGLAVGGATSLPGASDLVVRGFNTDNADLLLEASNGERWNLASATDGKFYLADVDVGGTAYTNRLVIDDIGRVGLNLETPLYALDVNGDVRWSGDLVGGNVPWARLSALPAGCASGFVTGVGGTLTCSTDGSALTGVHAADLACADCIGGAEIDEATLGNVPSATRLAVDGADCGPGFYARGVTAFGVAQGCTADAVDGGNAQTLDGVDSTQFLRNDQDGSLSGDLSFTRAQGTFGLGEEHYGGRVRLAGSQAFGWPSAVSYRGFPAHDGAFLIPVGTGFQTSDLRLYLTDDADERFSIWGDPCAGGNCGSVDAASEKFRFKMDGTFFSAGNVGIRTQPTTNALQVAGTVAATSFSGSGAGLSNVNAVDLTCSNCIGGTEILESSLGTVPSATQLASDGANCAAGSYASGVDALGNAQGCTVDAIDGGDAQTLDGLDSSAFATLAGAQTVTGAKTFTQDTQFDRTIRTGTASTTGLLEVVNPSSYDQGIVVRGSNAAYGVGLTLRNEEPAGHEYNLISTGAAADFGAGGFGIFDKTVLAYRLTIHPNGNVGIGYSLGAATEKLDVNGNVRFTGTLTGGTVPWARLAAFPSACTTGFATAVGASLTCSTDGSALTGVHAADLVCTNCIGGAEIDESALSTVPSASNANLLDGVDSSQFLRNDQSGSLAGNLAVTGRLGVTSRAAVGAADTLSSWEDFLVKDTNNGWGDLAIAASNNERWDIAADPSRNLAFFQFRPGGTGAEYVRFTPTGVGILTSSPQRALDVAGTARATAFEGDGALLTNLNAGSVASGTLSDARLSSNVPLKSAANTFTNTNTFSTTRITSTNSLEFGSGISKQLDAGKIGYTTWSGNALDIVGAGTVAGSRQIRLWEDVVIASTAADAGSLDVDGPASADSILSRGSIQGGAVSASSLSTTDGATIGGALSAATLSGDGAGLTNLNAANVASGTLADGRLSSNVALLDNEQTFTGAKTFTSQLTMSGANIGLSSGKTIALNPSDTFTYDGDTVGHYSLGWYPDSAEAGGNMAYLAGFGGIRFFSNWGNTMSITRFGDVSYTGTLTGGNVPWARLSAFPAACASGFVTGVGGTLTCSTDGSTLTGVHAADLVCTNCIGGAEVDESALSTVPSATSATTATQLAADGANCAAGEFAAGVDALGNAQGCAAASTGAPANMVTTDTAQTVTGAKTFTSSLTVTGSDIVLTSPTTSGADIVSDGGSNGIWYLTNTASAAGRTAIVGGGFERIAIENSGDVGIGTADPSRKLDVVGTARATAFEGNGALLTNLNAASLASGTVSDARLSSNVALLAGAQTFSGAKTFSSVVTGSNGMTLTSGDLVFSGNVAGQMNGIQFQSGIYGGSGDHARIFVQQDSGSRTSLVLEAENDGVGGFEDNIRLRGATIFVQQNDNLGGGTGGGHLNVAGDFALGGAITSGTVPWARLASFPSACTSGFVTAVGASLTCSTDGSALTNVNAAALTCANCVGGTQIDESSLGTVPSATTAATATSATTATQLGADGTNCALGEFASGVDAFGNAQGCAAASTGAPANMVTTDTAQTITGLKTHANAIRVSGTQVVEFGEGAIKQADAGKIGYGTFSGGASLDIVGAGVSAGSRSIQLWEDVLIAGTAADVGSLDVDGPASADSITSRGAIQGGALSVSSVTSTGGASVGGDLSLGGALTSGAVPWARLSAFPSACTTGFVTGVDATLACSTDGSALTGVNAADLTCANCIGGAEIDESSLATVPSATSATSATTATQLAADGTNCAPGEFATGIDVSGNAQGCAVPAGGAAANMVTTDTAQTITGAKTFSSTITASNGATFSAGDLLFNQVSGTTTNGIRFKLDPFGGAGDQARIFVAQDGGGEKTSLVIQNENDGPGSSEDNIRLKAATVYIQGNPGGGGLDANSYILGRSWIQALGGFYGSGAQIHSLNAGNVATGTLSDLRLSGNVALLSGGQTFTGAKTFSNQLTMSNANIAMSGNRMIALNPADAFAYDGKSVGHYSLGWWGFSGESGGSQAWLSGWGGIKFFAEGVNRMSLERNGDLSFSGTLTSGSVPWARLTSFPAACPAGQFVTGIGATLACADPVPAASVTKAKLAAAGGILSETYDPALMTLPVGETIIRTMDAGPDAMILLQRLVLPAASASLPARVIFEFHDGSTHVMETTGAGRALTPDALSAAADSPLGEANAGKTVRKVMFVLANTGGAPADVDAGAFVARGYVVAIGSSSLVVS